MGIWIDGSCTRRKRQVRTKKTLWLEVVSDLEHKVHFTTHLFIHYSSESHSDLIFQTFQKLSVSQVDHKSATDNTIQKRCQSVGAQNGEKKMERLSQTHPRRVQFRPVK